MQAPFLNDKTQFYIVSPQASIAGVANLDTLIKGRYITLRPSTGGKTQKTFEVLLQAPPLSYEAPGLHINLHSHSAETLKQGDPISYRRIEVGSIQQVKLAEDNSHFVIAAHIKQPYAHLVSSDTRFWKASGLRNQRWIAAF